MKTICNIYHNTVIYEGTQYKMNTHPLASREGFFRKIIQLRQKYTCYPVSYNPNGYRAYWEIKADQLYLIKLELIACTNDDKKNCVETYTKGLSLQTLFNTEEAVVLATWFTDKIEIILLENAIATHASDMALYQKESVFIRFEKGKSVKRRSDVITDIYPCRFIEKERDHDSLFQ